MMLFSTKARALHAVATLVCQGPSFYLKFELKKGITPITHVSLKHMCRLILHSSSIKISQRGIIQKRNKVELRFLRTALRVIARNMHTKFGLIWTYSDKVMLRTRKSGRRSRHRRRK